MSKETQKVAWLCTYIPEEIIHAAGFQPYRLVPGEIDQKGNCKTLPSNFCPYVKEVAAALEKGVYNDFISGFVVSNSCNAMIHLYNVLKEMSSDDQFVYLLDLPRKNSETGIEYYNRQLEELYNFLYKNRTNKNSVEEQTENLKQSLKLYSETQKLLQSINYKLYRIQKDIIDLSIQIANNDRKNVNDFISHQIQQGADYKNSTILLTGGIISREINRSLIENSDYPLMPENCMGLRYLMKSDLANIEDQHLEQLTKQQILGLIAKSYLNKPECPRTFTVTPDIGRVNYLKYLINQFDVKGVIHHDLGFCDLSNYDYLIIQDLFSKYNIPVLKINSELGEREIGQIKTRVEAFYEMNLI
ncbi:2-hydroxyacyl-CoA dehydratase family protein [Natranaerobius thermophilus]|uniref:2-hydroxyglutaryl-CoA dehydratase D-component n=1 Tax=Natranaerobius thermophilus (strain ATCC BAA-1301 / DSM 18059 / JW/NM-WN-LF) TaxID=457570 RepID=B2A5I9_NATTJ|nr:2-hydroxyacyl-CoA dehydratase family protein [Natranaerobius thermophilus]ACB85344.1 2-hydroxyglutaryl-CoA dehydratase D-component [Natranaerobius thermophilus JW/NM-WN-LF]